ncbi:MAG: membrane protein insertion efficiency factor YidD [Alphaproteobacteria bacterium]|nr:membrane protein insertion efficiency factor YidD [Alphaproteobacteria bacterium]
MMKAFIRFYRFFLSPIMGNQCRFHPTCSHFAEEAYEMHGFLKGTLLTVIRIFKCNPWYKGQPLDPVPKRFAYKDLFLYKMLINAKKKMKDK